jgi:hypothetical protein
MVLQLLDGSRYLPCNEWEGGDGKVKTSSANTRVNKRASAQWRTWALRVAMRKDPIIQVRNADWFTLIRSDVTIVLSL